jgi:hypothetical protein
VGERIDATEVGTDGGRWVLHRRGPASRRVRGSGGVAGVAEGDAPAQPRESTRPRLLDVLRGVPNRVSAAWFW